MGVLADKIRAKYPGAYQGVADEQLEAAVIAKYPQYARVSQPAPAEPSLLQSAMAGPGQAVDRLLGAVVPGEAGKRLAANEATAGQELAKAFIPGYDAPATPTEIAAGIVQPHVGAAMALGGLGHGRALQKATVEFAGDALRDPYTWGALGALKRLGLVGKGLTAGANAIFALKAGEAVPGEFAEAKRLYDEKGFTPEVTEAIAKGVLLGGAAALGARGTLKEGAAFGKEATAAGGRVVRGVAEKANRIPGEALEGLGTSAGAGIGASIAGGPGAMVGQLLGKQGGAVIKALLQRLAAEKAGVPTEVVDVPAPRPDLAPGETLRPVQAHPRRPYVPEFRPETLGLEPVLEAPSAAPPAAARPAPPVEAPAPASPRTMADVLVSRTPEGGWIDRPSIQDVLNATRLSKPVEFPGMTPEDVAIQVAAQEASVARVKAKDLMARAFEAQLKAQAPGAKPATVKAAERAQQRALEAKTLADTLMARFDESGDWNPEYPQWSPAMPAEARWANQPPNPAVAGITPPKGGHVPVGAEVFPRRPGEVAAAVPAVEAPPPPAAPPVEAPALLPEGQRAMPGGRSGEAQAPPAEFRGLDTPEKQAAFAQLQRLLAGEPVEAAPAKAPYELSGSDVGRLYHSSKQKITGLVDRSKLQGRDSGFYGSGFYTATTPGATKGYGPVLNTFDVGPSAKVLKSTLKPSDAAPELMQAVLDDMSQSGRAAARARGKEQAFDAELERIKTEPLDWKNAVDRFAERRGYDIVMHGPNEVVIKNPSVLTAVERGAAKAKAKAPTSVEAELMRLLSELPPPPEGSPTVIRASKRKRVSK